MWRRALIIWAKSFVKSLGISQWISLRFFQTIYLQSINALYPHHLQNPGLIKTCHDLTGEFQLGRCMLFIAQVSLLEEMAQTRMEFQQLEKLAAIGIMAGGIAHQLNNRMHLMGLIAGDLRDNLMRYCSDPEGAGTKPLFDQLDRGLLKLGQNVTQGRDIVQGMMAYAGQSESLPGPCSLSALLDPVLDLISYKYNLEIFKIERDLALAPDFQLTGYATELKEVFFNLIDNACHAMQQRAEEMRDPAYRPLLLIRAFVTQYTLDLVFQDNGIGIRTQDQPMLFTPFYSTKTMSGKGTGLGLYVIRHIVEERHHGRIEIHSSFGGGTTVCLAMPLV